MKKLFKEFRNFAVKGNVMDMTIGVIIGGAFGKVVSSIVSDILMPPIGLLTGGVDFSSLVITLKSATGNDPAVTINYGAFINSLVDFLIISLTIFLLIRGLNKLKKKEESKPAGPSEEVLLLSEIRDLLKKKSN